MKELYIFLFFAALSTTATAQNSEVLESQKTIKHQYIGSSLSKILFTSLINANYSLELNTYFTTYVEGGYGINMANTSVFASHAHENQVCQRYQDLKISGGFLKIGMLLNLRQNMQKKCFTHVGVFFNNALVAEKGNEMMHSGEEYEYPISASHTVYVPAVSITAGLDVKLWKRLWSNFDIQFSFPDLDREKMYGYSIPGMGGSDGRETYIMFTFNLKYQLPL